MRLQVAILKIQNSGKKGIRRNADTDILILCVLGNFLQMYRSKNLPKI